MARKKDSGPSSLAFLANALSIEAVDIFVGSNICWRWMTLLATSQGLPTISYASPAHTPPVTSAPPWMSRGTLCFIPSFAEIESRYSTANPFAAIAVLRVSSKIEKKTAKPAFVLDTDQDIDVSCRTAQVLREPPTPTVPATTSHSGNVFHPNSNFSSFFVV